MNNHTQFNQALLTLPDGNKIQEAYRQYKTAEDGCAFELNGRLKSGLPLGNLLKLHENLRRAICAENHTELTLYRMTSDFEFIGPLLPALNGSPFQYQAFLSASGSEEHIHRFQPANGSPLVLQIICPPGTRMALMEARKGGEEDEYLLGCGTCFMLEKLVSADRLRLRVDRNPPYAATSCFKF